MVENVVSVDFPTVLCMEKFFPFSDAGMYNVCAYLSNILYFQTLGQI